MARELGAVRIDGRSVDRPPAGYDRFGRDVGDGDRAHHPQSPFAYWPTVLSVEKVHVMADLVTEVAASVD